jgi:hypothetical protein
MLEEAISVQRKVPRLCIIKEITKSAFSESPLKVVQ